MDIRDYLGPNDTIIEDPEEVAKLLIEVEYILHSGDPDIQVIEF